MLLDIIVVKCWIQLTTFFLGTDEEDTCYAKLLLASQEEVLKEVILFLLLTFMDLVSVVLTML